MRVGVWDRGVVLDGRAIASHRWLCGKIGAALNIYNVGTSTRTNAVGKFHVCCGSDARTAGESGCSGHITNSFNLVHIYRVIVQPF